MQHKTDITVRFGETDMLGHVNNVNYFSYLEHARIQLFKKLASDASTNAWSFIVASIKCDFLAQAYFDQELTIVTTVARIGSKSFELAQPICDSRTGKRIAKGHSTIVYFDYEEQTSKPIPEELKEQLAQYTVE